MTLRIKTSTPEVLLDSIKRHIRARDVDDWEVDSEGNLLGPSVEGRPRVWIRPKMTPGVELGLTPLSAEGHQISMDDAAAFDADALSMLLTMGKLFFGSIEVDPAKSIGEIEVHVTSLAARLRDSWAKGLRHVKLAFQVEKWDIHHVNLAVSAIAFLFMAICFAANWIRKDSAFLAYATAVLTLAGLFVSLTTLESALGFLKRLEFSSPKLFWLGVVAVGGFIAHGQAADEVNQIFGVDASALPHTLTAATVFTVLSWCFWLFIVAFVFSFALTVLGGGKKVENGGIFVSLGTSFALAICVSFMDVHLRHGDVRKRDLTSIALAMDFDGKFRCSKGVSGTDSVLFIGPDQTRALLAWKNPAALAESAASAPDAASAAHDASPSPSAAGGILVAASAAGSAPSSHARGEERAASDAARFEIVSCQ